MALFFLVPPCWHLMVTKKLSSCIVEVRWIAYKCWLDNLIDQILFVSLQFLLKMLDDRNPSVKSVKDSGETLQKNLKPQEKKAIQNQISQLDKRWDALNTSAQDRAKTLENIMGIAQEFQDKREPLITWLDGVEKKFTSLEPSAMDVDGIENIIGSLEEMERELESKDGQVKQLAAIAKELQNHCKGMIFFSKIEKS